MKHLKKINENTLNKEFIAVLHQSGGCDYTIECGTKVVTLSATDMNGAKQELSEMIEEEYTGDSKLSTATIYEISDNLSVDLRSIYSDIKRKNDDARTSKANDFEKNEYERLHKKFGGK